MDSGLGMLYVIDGDLPQHFFERDATD